MTDSTISIPHPSDIRIDKEGTWFFQGAEMVRKEIVQLFYQHLKRDASGRYIIEMPNDCCYIEVEDVPFVVKSVHRVPEYGDDIRSIQLLLNDETMETLKPGSLRIDKSNVLYCSVKEKRFDAKFSRASYYQIADFIRHDSENNSYYINIGGIKYPVNAMEC
jgi:hypothetical protein